MPRAVDELEALRRDRAGGDCARAQGELVADEAGEQRGLAGDELREPAGMRGRELDAGAGRVDEVQQRGRPPETEAARASPPRWVRPHCRLERRIADADRVRGGHLGLGARGVLDLLEGPVLSSVSTPHVAHCRSGCAPNRGGCARFVQSAYGTGSCWGRSPSPASRRDFVFVALTAAGMVLLARRTRRGGPAAENARAADLRADSALLRLDDAVAASAAGSSSPPRSSEPSE